MLKIWTLFTHQLVLFWKYLGFFQKPFFRILHLIVIVLVFMQLFSSAGMGRLPQEKIIPQFFMYLPTWYHIGAGFLLCVISLIMLTYCLRQKGMRNYFPYIFWNFEPLKKDIATIKSKKPISPHPGGILTIIYGLGLISLVLTAFSGAFWFINLKIDIWTYGYMLKDIHKTISGVLIFFIYMHVPLAIVRFIYWQRTTKQK